MKYLLYHPSDTKLRIHTTNSIKECGDKIMVDKLELEYEIISVLGDN